MDDITLTPEEQRRGAVLAQLTAGILTTEEAALFLGVSVRQVWRLRARYLAGGPATLAHGNRGRPSRRRLGDPLRRRVVELARSDAYKGAGDSHLTELLADHHDIHLSRQSVQRILREAGVPTPFPRRAPRHRSRRERMAREGLLLQVDGSRHDWLEGRGPWLTLAGAIDDATSSVVSATFRDQEDSAGYLWIIADTATRLGLPLAVYRDRHTAFETPAGRRPPAELRLTDDRRPTHVGRALADLGIGSIPAGSPQAKGRVERGWGTLQHRLIIELRLAGASDRASADEVLAAYLPRYNARFGVPAADPEPAWRPVPPGVDVRAVCAFRYDRVIANDATVRIGSLVLDIPRQADGRSLAGRPVEVRMELDGRLVVADGTRELLVTRAPMDPDRLRDLERARLSLDRPSPAPAPGYPPATDHPWRRATPGSALEAIRRSEARGRDDDH
jgi:transposase